MIGLITDSTSQLPPELARRYRVEVVPLTVTVDGTPYLEGEELDADAFYAFFETAEPDVTTSQPSPGRFVQAYRRLAERGAEEILSLHGDERISGSVNAARVAAEMASVRVRVVDTGTVSFGVACCVWEAGEALAAGASMERTVAMAQEVGGLTGNVFVVRGLDLARAGGRLKEPASPALTEPLGPGTGPQAGIPVLSVAGGAMEVVGRAADLDEAADVMARWVQASGEALRVGVGLADIAATPLRDALERRLAGAPEVVELVRYRVGPSVGAHTGPGTVGAVYYPSPFRQAAHSPKKSRR